MFSVRVNLFLCRERVTNSPCLLSLWDRVQGYPHSLHSTTYSFSYMVDTPTSDVTVLGAGLSSPYELVPLDLRPFVSTGAVNWCWGSVPFPICYIPSLVPPSVCGNRCGLSWSHPPVHVFSSLLHNRTFCWTFEPPVSRRNKNWFSTKWTSYTLIMVEVPKAYNRGTVLNS